MRCAMYIRRSRADVEAEKMGQGATLSRQSMSPKQYLMQVRINAAKKMLLSGAYTVGETALSCGFSDASSFCSRFKRCTGMTPKAFILNSRSSSQSSVEGE